MEIDKKILITKYLLKNKTKNIQPDKKHNLLMSSKDKISSISSKNTTHKTYRHKIFAEEIYNKKHSEKRQKKNETEFKTEIIDVRTHNPTYKYAIAKATKIILDGGLVVFPTETVYGLGANAFDPKAVIKIYKIKNREQDNPLIVHVNSIEMARMLTTEMNEDVQILASKFWPGPLTLILPKSFALSDEVTAKLDTVAIRFPDNKVALDLISATKVPIAAPSANISGKPSVTKAEHAFQELNGKVELILDGGMCKIGIESTVISLVHKIPTILREGKITREEIENALNKKIEVCKDHCEKPLAPGMKYKHYSPNAKIYVAKRTDKRLSTIYSMLDFGEQMKNKKKTVMFVFSSDLPKRIIDEITKIGKTICFRTEEKMAHELFDVFRKADNEKTDVIIIEGVEEHGFGCAIMDRLMRAAEGEIVEKHLAKNQIKIINKKYSI